VCGVDFEWDAQKEAENLAKHRVGFELAQAAFSDPRRILLVDDTHSQSEPRYFCVGSIGERILTVRFTLRGGTVRIIGAGYWRKFKKLYEDQET